MLVRLLGSVIVAVLILAAVLIGHVAWAALLAVAAAIAAYEGIRLVKATGREPTLLVALMLAPGLTLTGLFGDGTRLVVALGVVGALIAQIGRSADRRSTDDLAATLAWPIYIGVLMSYAALVRGPRGGLGWTVLLLTLVWANDSSAYLGGRTFGRTPFFASLSPKKTLEGFLSGMVAAVVVGLAAPLAAAALVDPVSGISVEWGRSLEPLAGTSPLALGAIGLAVAIIAPLGDLSKSFLKRQAGAKDSGALIPGHGGVLDRMDSLLFAAPLVYYAVALLPAAYPIVHGSTPLLFMS